MNVVIDFGRFRLELGNHAPGETNPPLWLYQNEPGDGLEVNAAEIDKLLGKYFDENM